MYCEEVIVRMIEVSTGTKILQALIFESQIRTGCQT